MTLSPIAAIARHLALTAASLAATAVHAGTTAPPTAVQGDCAAGSCTVIIECGGLPPRRAELRISAKGAAPTPDTAVFFMGGPGTSYWGDASRYAADAIAGLVQDNFRTVEVRWVGHNWAVDGPDGPRAAACRPASVIAFIHDYFDLAATKGQLHLTGNSAGAAQAAYALSHYGLASIVRSAVLSGGPPYARIDLGCFGDESSVRYAGGAPDWIDQTFGYRSESGPCRTKDASHSGTYKDASVVSASGTYSYPDTAVHFIFGTADGSNADEQGLLYFQQLLTEKTPYLAVEYIKDMPHELPTTLDGTAAVANALRLYGQ